MTNIGVTNIGTNSAKVIANNGTLSITVPAGGVPAKSLVVVSLSSQDGAFPLTWTITDTADNSYVVGTVRR